MQTKQKKMLPAYYAIIPKELWQEADALISYLKYFPFEQPTHCGHCKGTSFRLEALDNNGQALCSYCCRSCHRTFNRLTNTPFASMQRLEVLSHLAALYLTGLSPYELSAQVDFVPIAIKRREKAILWLMEERYPVLYDWWITHHLYQDRKTTLQVKQQKEYFVDWLKDLLNPPAKLPCPGCKQMSNCYIHNNRTPSLFCNHCKTTYRLIGQTALRNMHNTPLWPDFANLLMLGATDQVISNTLKISPAGCGIWRRRFLKQMSELNLHELIYWITWQRNRNRIITVTKKRNEKPSKKGRKKFKKE